MQARAAGDGHIGPVRPGRQPGGKARTMIVAHQIQPGPIVHGGFGYPDPGAAPAGQQRQCQQCAIGCSLRVIRLVRGFEVRGRADPGLCGGGQAEARVLSGQRKCSRRGELPAIGDAVVIGADHEFERFRAAGQRHDRLVVAVAGGACLADQAGDRGVVRAARYRGDFQRGRWSAGKAQGDARAVEDRLATP